MSADSEFGSTAYELLHPITARYRDSSGDREEQIEKLTLRRMKGADMRLADRAGGDVAKTLEMIARLSGLPIKVVDELDAADFAAIGEIIEGFTQPGRKTGETSSAS